MLPLRCAAAAQGRMIASLVEAVRADSWLDAEEDVAEGLETFIAGVEQLVAALARSDLAAQLSRRHAGQGLE